MSDTNSEKQDTYSEEETVARREAALQRMLNTPKEPRKRIAAKRIGKKR